MAYRSLFFSVCTLSILLIFMSGAALSAASYTEKVGDGKYQKKAWSGDWQGCTTATVSCDSDQYLVGVEKKGSTAEYSDYSCRPQWYYNFTGDNSCTSNTASDDWLGLEKEYSKSEAIKGGSASKEQCGAYGGGGPEAKAAVAIMCYEESAFEYSICDHRGPSNECISNTTHNVSGRSVNVSSIFEARKNVLFEAFYQEASLNISNSSVLSGVWKGGFQINTQNPVIKPGASFRPINGPIKIGNKY